MMNTKKWICLLAAFVLVFTLVPGQVVRGTGTGTAELGYGVEVEQDYALDSTTVGPTLAEGEHEQWIDRIADLPDYAATMYTWLEENASIDGALADPTLGYARNNGYFYHIGDFSDTLAYTYTDSPANAAREAARAQVDAEFDVIMDYCVAAYGAFDRDHPAIFWLSGRSMYTWSMSYSYDYDGAGNGNVTYYLEVYFYLQSSDFDVRDSQYQDLTVLAAAIDQRDADVERILADCPVDAPVDVQISYLNEVLTHTNAYNSAPNAVDGAMDPWRCVSALAGRTGTEGPVCEGYSRAFKVLCDELGIPCVLTEGGAKSSVSASYGAHMWNYVQVDGSWYAIDVTWNDPVVSGHTGAVSGFEREDWSLLGSETLVSTDLTFIQSHVVENVVTVDGLDFSNGPTLATQAYVRPDSYMDIAPYRTADGYTAPVKEGYVFAGWYADAAFTQPLAPETTTGWAYAKFVDQQVLTLKYQITSGTNAQSLSTDMRLLTSVDALDYEEMFFNVTFGGATKKFSIHTVFGTINAAGVTIRDPQAVFGADASYFVTMSMTGIPQAAFTTDMTVVPCWTTLDGTVVEGTSRTFSISDHF